MTSSRRDRLPSEAPPIVVPVVAAVRHHRRHHSDSGSLHYIAQMVESHQMSPLSSREAAGRRRTRPQTFIAPTKTHSANASTASVVSIRTHGSASGRRPTSSTSSIKSPPPPIAYIQPTFEHRYRMRSTSSSTGSSALASPGLPPPPPPAALASSSFPLPPPPPPMTAGLSVHIPTQAMRRDHDSGAPPSPLSPSLPSPPAFVQHQQRSPATSGYTVRM